MSAAFSVVIVTEKVAGFKQFVSINKWSNDDERSKNEPEPVRGCSEIISYPSSFKFIAHARGYLMIPYYNTYSESQPSYEENKQAIMHGLFSVIAACYNIYVC